MEKTALYQDSTFRKITAASTGFGLACMLGSAAAIRLTPGAGLQFGWHWSILIVAALAVVWNFRFWKLVWRLQEHEGGNAKQKLKFHFGVLLLIGLGTFLYPIRFIEQSHWDGILRGLVFAGAFLGTMFWLIYKCAKGFADIDKMEMERVAKTER